jgi:hypothetical protein
LLQLRKETQKSYAEVKAKQTKLVLPHSDARRLSPDAARKGQGQAEEEAQKLTQSQLVMPHANIQLAAPDVAQDYQGQSEEETQKLTQSQLMVPYATATIQLFSPILEHTVQGKSGEETQKVSEQQASCSKARQISPERKFSWDHRADTACMLTGAGAQNFPSLVTSQPGSVIVSEEQAVLIESQFEFSDQSSTPSELKPYSSFKKVCMHACVYIAYI